MKFIRKNGRIIPIFSKDERKDRGAKQVIGAGAVAAGGGLVAGLKVRSAENLSQQTFKFMEDRIDNLPKGIKTVAHGFEKANAKLRFSKKIAFGARLGAAAIAFAGINNILHNEKDGDLKAAAKLTGAAVASELVARGIYSGFKRRSPFSMPVSQSTIANSKALLKNIFKKAVL